MSKNAFHRFTRTPRADEQVSHHYRAAIEMSRGCSGEAVALVHALLAVTDEIRALRTELDQ